MFRFFWMRTAALFLMRSWRSTAVLALMIFSAVATLVFLSALATGTSDTMIRNSTGLYPGQVTAFGLPRETGPAELKTEGVTAVLLRHSGPGFFLNRGNMATVELVGVNPFAERQFSGLWRKKVSGRFPGGGMRLCNLHPEKHPGIRPHEVHGRHPH